MSYISKLKLLKGYSALSIIDKILSKIAFNIKVEFESLKYLFISTSLTDEQFVNSIDPRYKNTDDFIRQVKTRKQPIFFFQPSDKDKIVDMVKYYYPESVKQIIADADRICNHIFNLLGSGDLYLGKNINWHADFKTGFTWKPKYYKKIKFT